MTTPTSGNYEQGYRAVLVREDTKKSLRKFRAGLPERDLFQERRIATAATRARPDACAQSPMLHSVTVLYH